MSPRNSQAVKLTFKANKIAKAVGSIARGGAVKPGKISGILVQKDFQYMYSPLFSLLYRCILLSDIIAIIP